MTSASRTAKIGAQRTQEWRQRQHAKGLTTLTLVVSEADAARFREEAARSRQAHAHNRSSAGARDLPDGSYSPPRMLPRRQADDDALARPRNRLSAEQQQLVRQWTRRSGLPWHPNDSKLGDTLARHMAFEIHRQGWPLGQMLGSEPVLMARYGVSRNVLREAIRLLEAQGVAEMRRGGGGGLVVTAPRLDATLYAVGVYLEYHQVRAADLLATRLALEVACVRRLMGPSANALPAPELARHLHAVLDFEATLSAPAKPREVQHLHRVLAGLCGDQALNLFLDVVLRLLVFHSPARRAQAQPQAFLDHVRAGHRRIVQAMLAGHTSAHADKACRAMTDHIEGLRDWIA